MKFVLNRLYLWMPEFAKLPIEKQKDILVSLSYEIEDYSDIAKIEGVKIGHVLSCEKHPNSDRLNYCKVKTNDTVLDVVCGGKNVATGQTVAWAVPGSKVGEMLMSPKELRGIVSNGMILSIAEILGVAKDAIEDNKQGNIEVFNSKLLNLENNQQTILKELCADGKLIDLSILPDRSYVKSYLNLAMEISAITGFKLTLPMYEYKSTLKNNIDLNLHKNEIAYYAAIFNPKQHDSRINIKIRLYLEGIKPQDNINDNIAYIKLLTGITINVRKHNDHYIAEVIGNDKNTHSHYYKYALDLFLSIGMTQMNQIESCSEIIGFDHSKNREIKVEKSYLEELVGKKIDFNSLKQPFEKLHFNISETLNDILVSIPPYRKDINTKLEVIEEIIRIYGVNNISEKELTKKESHDSLISKPIDSITSWLSSHGFNEIKTYQLITEQDFDKYNIWHQKDKVKLDNSYTNKFNTFKSTLLPTLIEAYTYNYRKEYTGLNFFEIQHVYINGELKTSIGLIHDDQYQTDNLNPIIKTKSLLLNVFKLLKLENSSFEKISFENSIFNPYQSAKIKHNSKEIGFIGELHPIILRENKLIRVDKVKSKLYYFEIII